MSRSEERRQRILAAIVRDYVSTREPVGSKALVERYGLGVSPATVRSDMAALEEAGLIAQPHTSAGRIPTDQGYRHFVDSLHVIKPLSSPERRAIERLLEGAEDLDDMVYRAVRLLAKLTSHVALVQYPSLHKVSLRHLDMVRVGDRHLILIVITNDGRVEQRTVECLASVEDIEDLRAMLNECCVGKPVSFLSAELMNIALAHPHLEGLITQIEPSISSVLSQEGQERIAVAGTANLSRNARDFARSISPVLEALEENVILLKLMAHMEGTSVLIGQESHHEGLSEASLVSSSYEVDDTSVARIGVVGPTRMDYPGTIAAVAAVAQYLSEILSQPNHQQKVNRD